MKRAFEPFEKKVWLSSPTMHGSEIEYITEAYETNWMSTVGENINQVEQMTCEKTGWNTRWRSPPGRRPCTWR